VEKKFKGFDIGLARVDIMAGRVLSAGLLTALLGISLLSAVFFVPITHPIKIKVYERRERLLHDVEDFSFDSPTYFVSIYITRGRNIYADISANSSFNLFILRLDEWTAAISEGREYSNVFARFLNVSDVNAYFNAPEDGYYIFEIHKMSDDGRLKLNLFQVSAKWTELVEKTSGSDYDYNIIVWGGILAALGTSIALYAILPRQPPQGILR